MWGGWRFDVCFGKCLRAPPQKMEKLATRLRGAPTLPGGLALGTELGCREKEQERRRQSSAGREGDCCHGRRCKVFWDQNSHCRGLVVVVVVVGRVVGEGDGEANVFLLSLALPPIPADNEWSPIPPGTGASAAPSPVVPSLSCPSAPCTEGSEWPLSRRPVYQHNNGKLVLLKGIQHLSWQTSSLQWEPAMPSTQNLLKGVCCTS